MSGCETLQGDNEYSGGVLLTVNGGQCCVFCCQCTGKCRVIVIRMWVGALEDFYALDIEGESKMRGLAMNVGWDIAMLRSFNVFRAVDDGTGDARRCFETGNRLCIVYYCYLMIGEQGARRLTWIGYKCGDVLRFWRKHLKLDVGHAARVISINHWKRTK